MKNGFHFQFIFSKNNKKRFSNVHKHTCSVYMNRHICVEHLKKYPHKKEFNSWKKYYVRLCSLRSTALDMFLGSFELHERNYFLLSSFYFFFIVVVYKWKIHAYTRRFWWYFHRKKERKKSRRHENYVYGVQKSEILLHKNNKLHQPWMMGWDNRTLWVSLLFFLAFWLFLINEYDRSEGSGKSAEVRQDQINYLLCRCLPYSSLSFPSLWWEYCV